MKSFEVIPVLQARCTKLQQHYHNLLKGFDAEEIHEFRVQAKKLNAFRHLLNAGNSADNQLKKGKAFRRLYQAVGQLRNLQVHADDVLRICAGQHLAVPHNYLQRLRRQQKKAKAVSRHLARRNSLQSRCRNLLRQTTESISEQAVENLVAQNKHRLFKLLLTGNYSDECLHDMRKLLKQILYLWPWLEAELALLPSGALLNKNTCTEIGESLGRFQDCCVALRLLDDYNAANRAGTTEAATLHELHQYVLDEKLRLKEDIVAKLQSLVQMLWERDELLPLYERL